MTKEERGNCGAIPSIRPKGNLHIMKIATEMGHVTVKERIDNDRIDNKKYVSMPQ